MRGKTDSKTLLLVKKYIAGKVPKAKVLEVLNHNSLKSYMSELGFPSHKFLYSVSGPVEKSCKEFWEQLYLEYLEGSSLPEIESKYLIDSRSIKNRFFHFKFKLKSRSQSSLDRMRSDSWKESFLKKYGVDHFSKTEEFKTKFRDTCLERYGETTNLKSESTKAKIKKTCLSKYGETSPTKVKEVQEKALNWMFKFSP